MSKTDETVHPLAKIDHGPGAAAGYALVNIPQQESMNIIRENLGNTGGVRAIDLDRAKIPAGGGTMWQVPSLEGDDAVREIKGIIIYWSESRRYWSKPFSGGAGERPDCASDDAIMGVGTPGGECAGCKFSQFGTDKGGTGPGQACKQVRQLFILRADDFMPLVVTLPPTSLTIARGFFLRLAGKMIPYYGVVTSLALEKKKNKAGIDYAAASFKVVGRVSEEEMKAVNSIRAVLVPSIQKVKAENRDFAEAAAN